MTERSDTSDHNASQTSKKTRSPDEIAWLVTMPSPDMNGAIRVYIQKTEKLAKTR